MDAILKADYGDRDQKAANDADRARAGARQTAAVGVRLTLSALPHGRGARNSGNGQYFTKRSLFSNLPTMTPSRLPLTSTGAPARQRSRGARAGEEALPSSVLAE